MVKKRSRDDRVHGALTVLGVVLCVILIPILVINCILLVQGLGDDRAVPHIGGVFPMIVLSDSMYPLFESGDLILCRQIEAEAVTVGDVITYFDPDSSQNAVVTHRVLEIIDEAGARAFLTKGDFNNAADNTPIPAENLLGVYTGRSISGAGDVAMFLQTTPGLILCVGLPVLLLLGYDYARRRIYEKKHDQDKEQLLAELEELRRLRAEADARDQAGEN